MWHIPRVIGGHVMHCEVCTKDDVLHLHLLSVMESRQAVHGGGGGEV